MRPAPIAEFIELRFVDNAGYADIADRDQFKGHELLNDGIDGDHIDSPVFIVADFFFSPVQ